MINKLMLSCRVATALMEKRHREKISLVERIQLSVHVALCSACRNYQKQSVFLEKLMKNKKSTSEGLKIEEQVVELEKKIILELDKKN